MASRDKSIHRKAKDYRWEGVPELPYKEDDRALFKSITRQVLFADPQLHGELRYFEVAPGGFSTLERHQHMHAVVVLRGRGHCLVGEEVRAVETRDLGEQIIRLRGEGLTALVIEHDMSLIQQVCWLWQIGQTFQPVLSVFRELLRCAVPFFLLQHRPQRTKGVTCIRQITDQRGVDLRYSSKDQHHAKTVINNVVRPLVKKKLFGTRFEQGEVEKRAAG